MSKIESIVLGGGCFWCTETVFKQLRGVMAIAPGYAGGETKDPAYEQVSTGTTGHAEVIKIDYDSEQISTDDILSVFFSIHDPTTLNRQGHDSGTQYRSIILFTTPKQKNIIRTKIVEITTEGIYTDPIVTEIKPLVKFYEAEEYHYDYFTKNPNQMYCQLVINPKLKKFKEKWNSLVK